MVGVRLLNREEERAELEPLLDLASFLKGCGERKRNGAEWLEITLGIERLVGFVYPVFVPVDACEVWRGMLCP